VHSLTWRESLTGQATCSSNSITSLTWRECCSNWPTSHTQSSTAWPQQPTGKTDTGFPTGSTMTGWSHGYGLGTKIPHIGSISSDRGCLSLPESTQTIPELNTDFSPPTVSELHEVSSRVGRSVRFRRCTRVFLQRSDHSRSDGRVEWRRNSSHGSSWPFYSHAPGLTLVTLGTACFHQHAFLPPFGSHMSFQKNLG
jgi:hypothetical protein